MRSRPLALVALALLLGLALVLLLPRPAQAFGDVGAFDPRVLLTGNQTGPARVDGAGSLVVGAGAADERASAPPAEPRARRRPGHRGRPVPLLERRDRGRSADRAPRSPASAASSRSAACSSSTTPPPVHTASRAPSREAARREIARALPDTIPVLLGVDHVIFRTFYLLRRAEGRVEGPPSLDAIVRGGQAQVLFSEHDLGGALARGATGMLGAARGPRRRLPARARHPLRGQHRHVRPVLELQGRPGSRALPHAPARLVDAVSRSA